MRAPDYRSAAEKIRDLRDERGLGLEGAKRIVLRAELRDEIRRCETVDDLKSILLQAFPEITP